MATNPPLSTRPLSAFTRLSSVVSLYDPPTSPSADSLTSSSCPPPSSILICSWLNARPKNISYYTDRYMTLYPHARIILVTINTTQFLLQSETRRRQDVQTAADAILARGQHDTLLVHSFSNGGGKRFYGVAAVCRKMTGQPFAPKAVVFDSAPGIPSFHRDLHALMVAGRNLNWLLWVLFAAATLTIVSVLNICIHVSAIFRICFCYWPELKINFSESFKPPISLRNQNYCANPHSGCLNGFGEILFGGQLKGLMKPS